MPESETHKILRIPCQNQEHNENLIIRYQHHENYGIHIIPRQNNENH